MKNDQLKEFLDLFNTAMKFSNDLNYLNISKKILENYNRVKAISHIQKLIEHYKSVINQFGFISGGVYVIYGVDYLALNDFQIRDQLIYISQRIPIYAFIREGEEKVANNLLNRVANLGFEAYK